MLREVVSSDPSVTAMPCKSAGNEERKTYVPVHLVPSDPVPQTTLGTELNQETPGRPHHLSFVSDYVGVPEGAQYPGFLSDSRRSVASRIRFRRLENDLLKNIDIVKGYQRQLEVI